MDDKLSTASKKVLVEIVKFAQKQGRKGTKGEWKEFLNAHDRKLGSCVSDPAKRPRDTLVSFLRTFTDHEDLKFFERVFQLHFNRELLEKIVKESPKNESPEQRLVHLTLEHPLYISKFAFPSYDKDWVITKISKKSMLACSDDMLAVDCEMVLCEDGTDALVRVCVVDHNLQVKLNEHVNPCKPVADYRTEITGIAAGDLDAVSCSLVDVQKSLKKLISKKTILVGHSLYSDMQALKLDHAIVIDTSFVFKTAVGNSPSLNNLCKSVLGYELHKEGAPHNCLDDARATMKLVLAKIEHGVDSNIPLIQEDTKKVPETEMAKLLVHRIPVEVPIEELRTIFAGNFAVELKPLKKTRGIQYSALAIFKSPDEAHQAFTNVNGRLEKDNCGLPQKLVSFQPKAGPSVCLYVRKMGHDNLGCRVSEQKRPFQGEDSGDAKKLKTDLCDDHSKEIERLKIALKEKELNRCDDHVQEIERLKKELNAKDFQISTQDKLIVVLNKKLEDMKKKLEETKKKPKK